MLVGVVGMVFVGCFSVLLLNEVSCVEETALKLFDVVSNEKFVVWILLEELYA